MTNNEKASLSEKLRSICKENPIVAAIYELSCFNLLEAKRQAEEEQPLTIIWLDEGVNRSDFPQGDYLYTDIYLKTLEMHNRIIQALTNPTLASILKGY